MGNTRSRRSVDATLKMLAKTVIRAEGRCLAVAENKVLLDFNRARSVTVENVVIRQVAEADVDCEQTVEVRAGTTLPDVEQQMQRLVANANSRGGRRPPKLVEDVTMAITRDTVNACISTAVNDFAAVVAETGGDVRIADLTIDQIAEARILECLQGSNVQVGKIPLREYLETELPFYDLNEKVLYEAPACPVSMIERTSTGFIALGGSLGLALLLVLVYSIWRATQTRRHL
jgi:hypothetical protein